MTFCGASACGAPDAQSTETTGDDPLSWISSWIRQGEAKFKSNELDFARRSESLPGPRKIGGN